MTGYIAIMIERNPFLPTERVPSCRARSRTEDGPKLSQQDIPSCSQLAKARLLTYYFV
jgi:hypothetical protein